MDKLVRQIELPLAKHYIKKAGLYIVPIPGSAVIHYSMVRQPK